MSLQHTRILGVSRTWHLGVPLYLPSYAQRFAVDLIRRFRAIRMVGAFAHRFCWRGPRPCAGVRTNASPGSGV
jgi:hypothetical protein